LVGKKALPPMRFAFYFPNNSLDKSELFETPQLA